MNRELREPAPEPTSTPREVVEATVAYGTYPTEAAYARSDSFGRRRLMDDWPLP